MNECETEPIWIAHMAKDGIGPDEQNIHLAPHEHFDFATPSGLSGARYWPKMRCNARGNSCGIGESGGPGETCDPAHGCAPPVDTKFEATFDVHGSDWVDMSLVDGFTLPFKLEIKGGDCNADAGGNMQFSLPDSWGEYCDGETGERYYMDSATGETSWEPPIIIDCSRLAFDSCPTAENMGSAGVNVSLNLIRPGGAQEIVGCYSPCSKLLFSQWENSHATGLSASDSKIARYCCRTPPESPAQCRTGPVGSTQFVQNVHKMCPGVYGYAYDDGMGLLRCTTTSNYVLTFYCPVQKTVPAAPPFLPSRTPCKATTARGTDPANIDTAVTAPVGTLMPERTPEPTSSSTTTEEPLEPQHPALGSKRTGWLAVFTHILQVVGLSQSHGVDHGRQYAPYFFAVLSGVLTLAASAFILCRRVRRLGSPESGHSSGRRSGRSGRSVPGRGYTELDVRGDGDVEAAPV